MRSPLHGNVRQDHTCCSHERVHHSHLFLYLLHCGLDRFFRRDVASKSKGGQFAILYSPSLHYQTFSENNRKHKGYTRTIVRNQRFCCCLCSCLVQIDDSHRVASSDSMLVIVCDSIRYLRLYKCTTKHVPCRSVCQELDGETDHGSYLNLEPPQ